MESLSAAMSQQTTALIFVSDALRKACDQIRASVFLGRYGGDEFIVIVKTGDEEKAMEFKSKILWFLNTLNQKANSPYEVSTCIGYAKYNGDVATFESALSEADQKLYDEKAEFKNASK